jgi:hypothetical protein
MIRGNFVQRLEAALVEPMTSSQRTFVDARVNAAIAQRGRRSVSGLRRLTTRTSLLVALLVLVVIPTVFGVSAALLLTESPFGLSSSAEFNRELEAAKAATPIPPGYAWPGSLRAKNGDFYSRGGGRSWVESVAICMWQVDWLDARQANDPARQTAARLVILGYPTWQSYGGPFGHQSYRDVMDRVIAAVGRDDPMPVTANVDLNCRGVRP